tara:strand:- start:221 stop:1036 length:816 start_codon:yes stop_codon:yes gene_type:complete
MNDNFELTNKSNYEKDFEGSKYKKIFNIYEDLLNDYLQYSDETVFIQDKNCFLFIIDRGLKTVEHVFKQLLMYTKNLEMVYFHSKKAYYYYIEFIGQISDDSHSYLQLTSKDATLFVYKKTVFEIDNSVRKNTILNEDEKNYLHFVSLVLNTIYDIIINTIQIYQKKESKYQKKNILTKSFQKCKVIFKSLREIEWNEKSRKTLIDYLYFSDNIKHFDLELDKYILLVKYFFRKSFKQNKTLNKARLISENNELYMNVYSELKYVNWIFGL